MLLFWCGGMRDVPFLTALNVHVSGWRCQLNAEMSNVIQLLLADQCMQHQQVDYADNVGPSWYETSQDPSERMK